MDRRFAAFIETFNTFMATHAASKDELFLTVMPSRGVSGLPPHLKDMATVSLVLGQRFRNAAITQSYETPSLVFDTTFANGPWQTVVIPLGAIAFYSIQAPKQAVQAPMQGQWWAVFDGGVQNSPRRPALSEAQQDAISNGLAERVGGVFKITRVGVSIRHSPTPNDVRIVQTYDGPVTGHVLRTDRWKDRAATGGPFGGKLRDFQAQAVAAATSETIMRLEPGTGKAAPNFTACPRAVSIRLDVENRVENSRDRVLKQMKIQAEALLALYLQKNPDADLKSVQIVTQICENTGVIRMYLEPRDGSS